MARERNDDIAFLILLSLSRGPLHGYAIRKSVHSLSEGRRNLSTGTLYGALKRFLDLGLIASVQREPADGPETTRTRREYRLTEKGIAVLTSEEARLRHLVSAADRFRATETAPA
jgi:DNA-binding PadR family transcriptional regulator